MAPLGVGGCLAVMAVMPYLRPSFASKNMAVVGTRGRSKDVKPSVGIHFDIRHSKMPATTNGIKTR